MRYFKIFNQNVTKTRPLQELTKDQFLADIADYCLDCISYDPEEDSFDQIFSDLIEIAESSAAEAHGLLAGDYYLYSAGDDKTVLDFSRKTS